MCGIVGFYSTNNIFSESELHAMTNKLSHRGPDADGFYYNNTVGLGHKRLSIIDLSNQANQPMVSHSGKSIIVYNGEIYNFNEIRVELGIETRTSSDTEVILEAFEKWGTAFVEKLNGMFAIAIYSLLENNLYFFRDRMGIKPLFYYLENNQLAFASELKALTAIKPIASTLEINQNAIGTFLHLGYIPCPETIYKHIYKFPQGSYGIFDGNDFEIIPYWKINEKITPETHTDFSTSKIHLNDLIQQSVKYRLISDVPYGTFLSGGIDSSLVSAVAQKVSNHQLKTFSIGFAESKFNESAYAQQVAKHLETDHYAFTLTEKEAIEGVPDIFSYYDEPFADSSAIPTMLVSKLAQQQVTMTLSGDGGDELFHGYGMYNWAKRLDNKALQLLKQPTKNILKLLGSKYKRVSHLFDWDDLSQIKSHIFSQEQYYFSENELQHLLKESSLALTIDEWPISDRKLDVRESQALFDLMYYLPDDLLTKVDRASMRYSLETRVPLLDYNVVEFALNLHPSLKVQGNTSKYLLKELLYDYVPREYFDRPKWGFGIPLNKWLKTDLKYLIDDYLSEAQVKKAGFVDEKAVSALVTKYLTTENEYLYNRVWVLICLHKWYFDVFLKVNA
jgi:asparagine synthase (glutamine-hydrolysing)